MRKVICESYVEHVYLQASNHLEVWERIGISKYFKYYVGETSTNDTRGKLVDGLLYLSEMLYSHFNKKAIVLIDDFDEMCIRDRDYIA